MGKYINADKLIDEIIFNEEDVGIIASKEVIDIIQNMPSADVRENKHGEWVYQSDTLFACTNCGEKMVRNVFPFCPWCGADMRGETE